MIPKKIHYCWFGKNPLPKLAQKCISSWNKYCSDYEIICWNEDNFDININDYVKEAYENKKFAFVTDFVRLFVLYEYGGIYMDTDVEVIQNLDEFLNHESFSGFESIEHVPTGIMASSKKNKLIGELLDYYDGKHFIKKDGTFDLKSNTETITEIMTKKGLRKNNKFQIIEGFALYPSEYFCPVAHDTKKLHKTYNTHTIHWFAGSWVPKKQKIKIRVYQVLKKIFSERTLKRLTNLLKKGK